MTKHRRDVHWWRDVSFATLKLIGQPVDALAVRERLAQHLGLSGIRLQDVKRGLRSLAEKGHIVLRPDGRYQLKPKALPKASAQASASPKASALPQAFPQPQSQSPAA